LPCKGNYDLLHVSTNKYPWENIIDNNSDLEAIIVAWTNTFLNLCKQSIPSREIRVKQKDVPWMNHEYNCIINVVSPLVEAMWKAIAGNTESL
jgi:hypothetical protein